VGVSWCPAQFSQVQPDRLITSILKPGFAGTSDDIGVVTTTTANAIFILVAVVPVDAGFGLSATIDECAKVTPSTAKAGKTAKNLAEAAVRAAIINWADGQPAAAGLHQWLASERLKELNKIKRQQRPPSDSTDSKRIEYLYGIGPCRFQIIKKTRRRIFYLKQGEYIDHFGEPTGELEYPYLERDYDRVGFIERQKLEATGEVHYLHASLQSYLDKWHRGDIPPPSDLCQLKADMAAAHPDRGGSNTAFIAARERYLAALRRCSNSEPTK
jgi:hypothetical protein